ncbi:MAG: HlyD family secretion protein [Hyphomicrobiales bacterium]
MSFWCIGFLAGVLPGCSLDAAPALAGFVEGEYTALAPIDIARVEAVLVRRGDRVQPGRQLAKLETSDAALKVRQAEARLAQAEAQLANLKLGKRPEEIAVIEATLASAKAQAREAELALHRKAELFRKAVSAKAELDQAQAAYDVAQAAVAQAEANLGVAKLPARPEEIQAMEQEVKDASSSLAIARWQLDERLIVARSAGRVFDVLKRQGETAGPTSPVIMFLPDGAIKIRFYSPEGERRRFEPGTTVALRCDGCPEGLTARVSYVADEPEFTPPVIYSVESRQKLVYLVEAKPDPPSPALQPGQIVDVTLPERPAP